MITRRKVTISLKENLYDTLKSHNIRISTLVNDLVERFLDEETKT